MSRNKLYVLLSSACAIGYSWLTVSYFRGSSDENVPGVCLFKHLTSIPCPSCGSTRSVLSLMHGNILESLTWNPFGLILMLILITSPIWILFDVIMKKSTLLRSYNHVELLLKRRLIAAPAILLVLANWLWNIYKGV